MPSPTARPIDVTFTVNGAAASVRTWPLARLLDVLRSDLGLTGTKEGCGEGECGACAVVLNGRLVNSCLVPVCQVAGGRVLTIEGVQEHCDVKPIREAFVVCDNSADAARGAPVPDPMRLLEMKNGRIVWPALDDLEALRATPPWARPILEAALSSR